MRTALSVTVASMLAGNLPAWADVSCAQYETLRRLPDAFKETGRGTVERRIGEPGTPGFTDLARHSDSHCDCFNMPMIERDRGRPIPDGKFWECGAAETGTPLPADIKDAE